MATRGTVTVIGMDKDGNVRVKAQDAATMQMLAKAARNQSTVEVMDASPRLRGGRPYPKLKLTKEPPRA